jgi:hypothetical protein
MLTLSSLAKIVLENGPSDFQGIIKELGENKRWRVGRNLPLLWANYCHFLASDYIFCFSIKGV